MLLLQSTAQRTWLAPDNALLVLAVAFVIGWACHRMAMAEGLRRFRALLRSLELAAGATIIVDGTFAVAFAVTDYWFFLGLGIIGVFVALNLEWLRNATAGIALAMESRFHAGDTVRLGETRGTIQGFDLRAVRLRSADGHHHTIPNTDFLELSVTSLAGGGDSACELDIRIPDDVSTERARALAKQAATMSPLASPRHRPEVFITTSTLQTPAGDHTSVDDRPRLHIRGYACQPVFRDHYRGDVLFRLLQEFESAQNRRHSR
jgi:small-conductance mechanosensitive channel